MLTNLNSISSIKHLKIFKHEDSQCNHGYLRGHIIKQSIITTNTSVDFSVDAAKRLTLPFPSMQAIMKTTFVNIWEEISTLSLNRPLSND